LKIGSEKKARFFEAGLGERSKFKKLAIYLFFFAAFFFAGISVMTSSPDFLVDSQIVQPLGVLCTIATICSINCEACQAFSFQNFTLLKTSNK
jgi:hypothetical protein